MKSLLLFALCVSATCSGTAQKPESSRQGRVLSVCDVLRDLERLNGRVVTVRGLIGWTGRHGVSPMVELGVNPYVGSCPGNTDSKHAWPPMLAITSPEMLDSNDAKVNFSEEQPGLAELIAVMQQSQDRADGIIATVTGQIQTRRRLRIERRADGDIIGNGFGQGECPALLVIKRVVAAEDRQTHSLIALPIAGGQ